MSYVFHRISERWFLFSEYFVSSLSWYSVRSPAFFFPPGFVISSNRCRRTLKVLHLIPFSFSSCHRFWICLLQEVSVRRRRFEGMTVDGDQVRSADFPPPPENQHTDDLCPFNSVASLFSKSTVYLSTSLFLPPCSHLRPPAGGSLFWRLNCFWIFRAWGRADWQAPVFITASRSPPPQVSFVAHFGGIVAGMTVGYVFFSAYNQKLLKDPRFWLCIVGYLLFLIFAVVFNIVLSPAP